jgi:endonuclease/exonuclease/phosphatase family metal-dependent hydrolase
MRIITWNCRGGFRGKAKHIAEFKPDILAVQEVEPIADIASISGERPTYFHREAPRPLRKSIGMLSYTDTKLTSIDLAHGIRRYQAQQGDKIFHVMAAWTSPTTIPEKKNYRQLHEALVLHEDWIRQRPTIVLGDFNQNAVFKGDGMSTLLELTNALGLVSAYHHFFGEEFGKETRPTHFHLGKEDKAFHLDYCFFPKDWKIGQVQVGTFSEWGKISDHAPLIVDLKSC